MRSEKTNDISSDKFNNIFVIIIFKTRNERETEVLKRENNCAKILNRQGYRSFIFF